MRARAALSLSFAGAAVSTAKLAAATRSEQGSEQDAEER
jgi:hypothetical protein